jgi:cullin-4
VQDKDMVDRLLAFKKQLDEVLQDALASSPAFADQLTSALQSSINSRSNKPAELVAKWIDAKLRGSKGLSKTDMEAELDRALVLFGYPTGCSQCSR